jgi:hypothetical protein
VKPPHPIDFKIFGAASFLAKLFGRQPDVEFSPITLPIAPAKALVAFAQSVISPIVLAHHSGLFGNLELILANKPKWFLAVVESQTKDIDILSFPDNSIHQNLSSLATDRSNSRWLC